MATVAREIEIEATSGMSIDQAVVAGVARACRTLGDVRFARIREMRADGKHGSGAGDKMRLRVVFVLDD